MTWKQALCAFLLMVSVTTCASPKIGYDYDRSANFTAYHTYDWVPGQQEQTGDKRVDNSQVDIRLRIAIDSQLRTKGYVHPVNGQPDFYVAYQVGLKDLSPDISTQYYSDGMAGRPFSHSADTRSAGHTDPPALEAQVHLTGSLLIDIFDAASNKLVWRGTAAGEIDPGLTSKERDQRARTIIHDIMSHFPPK